MAAADYGINATQVSAPSGAGSNPVSYQPVNNPQDNTVGLLGGIVDMFAKGASTLADVNAKQAQDAIIKGIAEKESTLNTALMNGEITAQEANIRSRANFNEALAANPGLAPNITQLYGAFKSTTTTGEREEGIKAQRDKALRTREKQEDDLRNAGYVITPTTTDAEFNKIWDGYQTVRQADQRFARMKQDVEWQRQSNIYNQQQADRETKEQGYKILTDIAGAQLNGLNAEMTSLYSAVKAGKIQSEEGLLQWNTRMQGIQGALVAAATGAGNPEAASSFRALFDQSDQLMKKLLDPKTNAENAQNELQQFMARQKLALLQTDPKIRGLAVVSNLFGNNQPILTSDNAMVVSDALLRASNLPVQNGQSAGFVPQIVGDPRVEASALAGLREGIKQLRSGNVQNKEAAKIEASNSVNQVLLQTGRALDAGASPQSLKGLATFFSSAEYGEMVKGGAIDPVAQQAAKKTFQIVYEPAVVTAITSKLAERIEGNDGKTAPLAASLDVKWNGAGFTFEAVKGSKAANAVNGLKTAADGLTQMVRLGAHLEGTTDYEKYWEKNKHLFLPNVFPDPARLKVGDVVQGRKYVGGNVSNPDNWVMQIPK